MPEETPVEPEKKVRNLKDLFKYLKAKKVLIDYPNAERSSKVIWDIEACLHCFTEVLNDRN
jgi:hypothetical protein